MKNSTLVALASTVGSIILHLLLTLHYYPLRFGFSGEKSSCSINSVFDCDAVSTSAYSALLGIPLSLWGLVTNALLLILIIGIVIQMAEEMSRLIRVTAYLSGFIALMSIVMGAISMAQLNTYCLYCIGTYVTSFITFAALHTLNEDKYLDFLAVDIQSFFSNQKVYLVLFVLVPITVFISNRGIVSNYGADSIDIIVQNSINQWKSKKAFEFTPPPTLTKGAKESFMVVSEFADFQCGHCRRAALPLSSFSRSHKDVKFDFYVFPLDGDCNKAIKQGRGTSCRLAKATYCAGQQSSELGWAFHDSIFTDQSKFPMSGANDRIDKILKEILSSSSINWEDLNACMESEATQEAILAQAQAGEDARVRGTPTIFVNGRVLPKAQLIPVLEAAYKSLKK